MTSQAALVNIQRVSKDCALSEVTRDGLDTVDVRRRESFGVQTESIIFRFIPEILVILAP